MMGTRQWQRRRHLLSFNTHPHRPLGTKGSAHTHRLQWTEFPVCTVRTAPEYCDNDLDQTRENLLTCLVDGQLGGGKDNLIKQKGEGETRWYLHAQLDSLGADRWKMKCDHREN